MTLDFILFWRNKKCFQIIFSPILFWIYFLYEVLVGISPNKLLFVGTGSLGSMFFDPVQVISDPHNVLDNKIIISPLSLTWRTDPQSCAWHSPRPCWPPRWARPCPQSGCREAPQSPPAQESTLENMIIIMSPDKHHFRPRENAVVILLQSIRALVQMMMMIFSQRRLWEWELFSWLRRAPVWPRLCSLNQDCFWSFGNIPCHSILSMSPA